MSSENKKISAILRDMDHVEIKNGKSQLPVVAIDGGKIRSIREAKKLTQLYVANVVGVTTDTISRWENNRYPTIKRDNAEKLAAALEVGLPEIERQEAANGTPGQSAPARPRRTGILSAGAAVILVVAMVFFYRLLVAVPDSERNLPNFGAPGEVIPVQIKIERKDSETTGFIVKEQLPAGWRFVGLLPPSAGKPGDGEVKWLIPVGRGSVTISYTVQIPPDAQLKSRGTFGGEIVTRVGELSRRAVCGGDTMMTVDAVHWADDNGDGRIDDNEIMPAYYMTEEMKGLGLDWKEIEAIWSGKGYRWDSRKRAFEAFR